MTRAHFVKKARKSYPQYGIKKGDSYYWWAFRFGPIMKSKTSPTRQQLTRSGFLQDIYSVEDTLQGVTTNDDFQSIIEDAVSQIEDLSSQCEDSLSNMPDNLQENSSSGQLLQERIDMLSDMQSDLEGIDTEVDEDGIKEDVTSEMETELNKKVEQFTQEEKDELDEKIQEKIEERQQEVVDEISGISYGGS